MYFGLVVARLSWVDSAWFVTSQSIKIAGSCSERSSHCGAVAFSFTAVRPSSPPPPLTLIPERYQTPRVQRLDDSTGRPVQRPWKSAGTVSARYLCLGQREKFPQYAFVVARSDLDATYGYTSTLFWCCHRTNDAGVGVRLKRFFTGCFEGHCHSCCWCLPLPFPFPSSSLWRAFAGVLRWG